MKKLLLRAAAFLAIFSINAGTHQAQFPFMSTLHYPASIKHPEKIGMVYKGMMYKSEGNSIEILEEHDATEFFILVAEELDLPKSPAVTHLFTATRKPYALYRIQRITCVSEQKNEHENPTTYYEWQITRLENKHDSLRLPENTMVLFMDPELVALESSSWKPDDVVIKLPTIVFKHIEHEADFNALCRKMLFAIMDIKFLHTDATKLSKQVAANCIISVPNTFIKS